jgi:predicted Rossmann fold nucleotide-binding protein DprA/Smf involved in DNA uptake
MIQLGADERAVLLACSSLVLTRGSGLAPFSAKEWSAVSDRALAAKATVGSLLGMAAGEIESRLRLGVEVATRLQRLLARDGQLTLELDRLDRFGIWVLTTASPGYPARLHERLGSATPQVLFGLGDRSLLEHDAVAVVGSRDADPQSLEFARDCGRLAASQEWVLVSGAARGVDAEAMRGAFEAGGAVVGVPPDGLERSLKDVSLRSALMAGRAAYVSPYRPDAPFSVGTAMGRNRLIYCLARLAIVANSRTGSGGTWSGAVEALGKRWVPVHVRAATGNDGNAELVRRGGIPLHAMPNDLEELAGPSPSQALPGKTPELVQQTLF